MDLFRTDPAESRVRAAIAAIAAGQPVVVVDDAERENEGDLVFAAALATPELVAFTVRHASGFLCVALPDEDCARLGLTSMYHSNDDRFGTAYQVTVDLIGTGTGISARSRAATIAALAAPDTVADRFTRPGHVVPLKARAGGVLARPGHTEAAVDLARLSGLPAAGALCEIVSVDRPGEMARGPELERFAATHGLVLITVDELIRHRRRTEQQVRRVAVTSLPTEHGSFTAVGYVHAVDGSEHVALVAGPLDAVPGRAVPVHVHSECLSGDVFAAVSCRCHRRLDEAMTRFATAGRGVIVYLRQEGIARACGLSPDGPTANTAAAVSTVAWILTDLGVHSAVPATGSDEHGTRARSVTPNSVAG